MEPDLFLEDEAEEEEADRQLDQPGSFSIPEGVGLEDPVRMYLKGDRQESRC